MKLLKSAPLPLMLCFFLSACSSIEKPDTLDTGKPVAAQPSQQGAKVAPIAHVQVSKVDPEWMAHYEARLREELKGSRFEVQRHNDLLVVTAPADYSFNPDRPTMLVPAALGPITKIAKLVEADKKTGIMVFGHADNTGSEEVNHSLTQERARSFGAIFRLSGLRPDRLQVKGLGSSMPRAANASKESRSQNRRVEMVLTPKANLNFLMAQYEAAYPSMLAAANTQVPAVAPKAVAKTAKTAAVKTAKAPTKKAKATAQKTSGKSAAKATQVASVDTKK